VKVTRVPHNHLAMHFRPLRISRCSRELLDVAAAGSGGFTLDDVARVAWQPAAAEMRHQEPRTLACECTQDLFMRSDQQALDLDLVNA
jgi:hypothetical protein